MVYLIGFFVGAALTSFYLTLGERILRFFYGLERKGLNVKQKLVKILFFPSSCNLCGVPVQPLYLIPFLGYFLTKQRCSKCKTQIPVYYPISEFLGGSLFVYSYFSFQNWFLSVSLLVLFGHLLISILTDSNKFSLDYENFPFILVSGMGVNFSIYGEFVGRESFYVLAGFLVFYIFLYIVYNKGIGLGDVMFAPILGFLCGHPWWILYFNVSYISAVVFTILLKRKTGKLKGTKIPMGAYLAIGAMIAFMAKLYHYSLFRLF